MTAYLDRLMTKAGLAPEEMAEIRHLVAVDDAANEQAKEEHLLGRINRCRAIMGHPLAQERPVLAACLAMTAGELTVERCIDLMAISRPCPERRAYVAKLRKAVFADLETAAAYLEREA